MTYIHYINMNKKQSEAAFQEYLDERGPALARLREALIAGGQAARSPDRRRPGPGRPPGWLHREPGSLMAVDPHQPHGVRRARRN